MWPAPAAAPQQTASQPARRAVELIEIGLVAAAVELNEWLCLFSLFSVPVTSVHWAEWLSSVEVPAEAAAASQSVPVHSIGESLQISEFRARANQAIENWSKTTDVYGHYH